MTASFDPKKSSAVQSSVGAVTLPSTTAGATYTSAEQTIVNNLVSSMQLVLAALREADIINS